MTKATRQWDKPQTQSVALACDRNKPMCVCVCVLTTRCNESALSIMCPEIKQNIRYNTVEPQYHISTTCTNGSLRILPGLHQELDVAFKSRHARLGVLAITVRGPMVLAAT